MDDLGLDRSIDFMIELEEMIGMIDKIRDEYRGRGLSWNRFRGDVTARIVAHYLKQHIPEDVKIVQLAWIEGCANEFDILIVDKDAKPIDFTSAYPKDQVRLLIEVKASGIFYKRDEVKKRLSELFKTWRDKTGKPVLYLSIWEARAHIEEVLKALGKDTAFMLVAEKKGLKHDEWERFVERVNVLLKR